MKSSLRPLDTAPSASTDGVVGETEAQTGSVTCPRSHSSKMSDEGAKSGPAFQLHSWGLSLHTCLTVATVILRERNQLPPQALGRNSPQPQPLRVVPQPSWSTPTPLLLRASVRAVPLLECSFQKDFGTPGCFLSFRSQMSPLQRGLPGHPD